MCTVQEAEAAAVQLGPYVEEKTMVALEEKHFLILQYYYFFLNWPLLKKITATTKLSYLRDAACPHMLHASAPVAAELIAENVWDASSGLSEWRSYRLKKNRGNLLYNCRIVEK